MNERVYGLLQQRFLKDDLSKAAASAAKTIRLPIACTAFVPRAGNEQSSHMQDKLGFVYRDTRKNVYWERLDSYKDFVLRVLTNPKYEV